jgi:hypothetical protein
VPVPVHENDVALTRHLWRYEHELPRSWYFTTQVRALPIVAGPAWCSVRVTRSGTARGTSPTATWCSRATRS